MINELLISLIILISLVIVVEIYFMFSSGNSSIPSTNPHTGLPVKRYDPKTYIQNEVFVISCEGKNLLDNPFNRQKRTGEVTGSAFLLDGYRYATQSEIDSSVNNGLKITGINDGDYIMYLTSMNATSRNSFPNIYIAKKGDFSKDSVTMSQGKVDRNKHKFYAFVYGIKPDKSIMEKYYIWKTQNNNVQHGHNLNILSPQSIIPWNNSTWNSPYGDILETLDKKEAIILKFQLKDSGAEREVTKTINSYNFITPEQIQFSVANGLFKDGCVKFWRGLSFLYGTKEPFYTDKSLSSCQGAGMCEFVGKKCMFLGIWGSRNNVPKSNTFYDVHVLPFNDEKISFYDN